MKYIFTILFAICCLMLSPARAQFVQQGSKLVGTGGVGTPGQGNSVGLSADGNTAIVGGITDNPTGAVWVFTRIAGVWAQEGSKLVGTGAVGDTWQGSSVSLSADGNTAIVGGPADNFGVGAAWVYTRSGGVWTQQGNKLVGTGAVGQSRQGYSVCLSADGNTVIMGGEEDDNVTGAAWVFIRIAGVWTQQGNKLVDTGAVGSRQGSSVSIAGDANTAIVGGNYDNGFTGAAWVYTRSGGVWTQQGNKLVGTGAVGQSRQGSSVSIAGDANTAIVGGTYDNGFAGAAWVYTRRGGVWTQQGSKLVGTGAVGNAQQGWSVSISADGNRAIVGAPADSSFTGATWVFTRSGLVWTQQGSKLVGTDAVGNADQGVCVSISADGNTAIVGGYNDNDHIGAAWVYSVTTTTDTISNAVQVGWNMISVPVQVTDFRMSSVYPTAGSAAFTFANGYQTQDTLKPGGGYWVKFGDSGTVQYKGLTILSEVVDVQSGWNMIGSISTSIPTSSITSIPGGIVTSMFFGYSIGGYSGSDSILPGQAYWVRVNADCKLVLSSSSAFASGGSASSRIRIVAREELPPPPPDGKEAENIIPTTYALEQNYPNPFNPTTTISFSIPSKSFVSLKIFDLLGREVSILLADELPAGTYARQWNAVAVSSGMYFYRLQAGSFTETKKILLLR